MLNESNILLEEDGIEEEILVDEETAITKAMWGDIGGNIENQTDLQNALDAKQDSLTEAQLNAVNSGITAGKVATYDGYADQIASKANQSALNAEANTRAQADTALGTRIDNEALARQQADNGLQSQIDAITSKSDVVDVVANYAALQAYDTSTLGNNDVIKVLDDETHEDALTYYRWSTTTQTWSYIGQEAPYYSKGQMDVKLQGKQDKLTAGANVQIQNNTISATDTTYTAGNGLNLNGTEFSADTDILATKEDLEDYYTKTETDNLLAPKLEAEVVAELPTTGTEGKLYLTPKAHTTSTATGNPITASVTEQTGAIESFELDGDTAQQTWTGKNILPLKNLSQGGINSTYNYLTGELSCSGTSSQNYPRLVEKTDYTIATGTTVTFSTQETHSYDLYIRFYYSSTEYENINIASGSTSTTTTLSHGITAVEVLYNTGTNVTISDTFKMMLEIGGSATSFEPYVGGQASPNPDYPQAIQTVTGEQTVTVVGKNRLNPQEAVVGTIDASTGEIVPWSGNTNMAGQEYIEVEPNTEYTIRAGTQFNFLRISEYTSDKANIIRNQVADNTSLTITTTPNTKYIRWSANYRSIAITNPPQLVTDTQMQIEKGSYSSYAPYHATTYPISLGSIELCKLGTYQDYIYKDGEDWKVHKATKGVYLKDITWLAAPTSVTGKYRMRTSTAPDDILAPADNNTKAAIKSSVYGVITAGDTYAAGATGISVQATTPHIFIYDPNYDTVSSPTAFTQKMANTNATAYYALATATDTIITDATLIAQLEAVRTASLENGANTITNTATDSNLAGDMEIGYYGYNPRNRYDKFIWLDLNNNYEQIGS